VALMVVMVEMVEMVAVMASGIWAVVRVLLHSNTPAATALHPLWLSVVNHHLRWNPAHFYFLSWRWGRGGGVAL